MAFTKITAAHNGRKALDYILGQKGHNGNKHRNEYVTGVNMVSPDTVTYSDQMERYWNRASDSMKVQVRRVTQSFSEKELDPNNPDDIFKAHEIGIETGKKFFGDRQFIVATQTDGKSGLVHNHIFGNNVDLITNKGMTGPEYHYQRLRDISDEVIKENGVELDLGESHGEVYTQTERAKREKDEYVWTDDLRDRIREAMTEATNEDEFIDALDNLGVGYNLRGKTLTYTLNDTSNYIAAFGKEPDKELKSRAKKLGNEFIPESLQEAYKRNLSGETEYEAEDEIEAEIEAPDVSEEVANEVVEEVSEPVDEVTESTSEETENVTDEEPVTEQAEESDDDDYVPDKITHISKKLDELYDEESEKVSIDLTVDMQVESDTESEARRIQEQIRQERLRKLRRSSVGEVADAYNDMRKRMTSEYGEKE